MKKSVSFPNGNIRHVENNIMASDIKLTDNELNILDRYFPKPMQKQSLDMI